MLAARLTLKTNLMLLDPILNAAKLFRLPNVLAVF
jgi:hypothetical protein